MVFGRLVLEKKVQFSKSLLWEAQRRYFDDAGVNAWSGSVPFYITSNPLIANAYAQVIIRWIQEMIAKKKANPKAPFYIFELGTGSGRFSFMALRRLIELQEKLGIEAKIVYVMTDFTASNLSFWESHEKLKPFIQSGQLDFAVYDMDKDIQISLIKSGVNLSPKTVENPIALIGNYIFDTVSDDAFYVKDGQLYESLITVDADTDNVVSGMPIKLENLGCTFSHEPILGPYYQDPVWQKVLSAYETALQKGSFLLPVGGFKSLDLFRSLSNDRMLLISTDKGYSFPYEMEGREDAKLVFHGSFSMTVNFHAIGEYFKALGGEARYQSSRDSIKTCVYLMGASFNELPELALSVDDYMDGFSPGDYFSLHRNLREMKDPAVSMTTLLAQMCLSHWDPYVLGCFFSRVMSELGKAPSTLIQGFAEGADKMVKNIYEMPGSEDYYFQAGMLYHFAEWHEKAIACYEKSLKIHGKKFGTYYNLGLCYYMAKEWNKALESFEASLPLDKEKRAWEWIKKIKSDQQASASSK